MKRSITTILGTYFKAMETKDFLYYVNYQEGDENGCVMIYNREGELICDNYHAYNDMFERLENKDYTKISRRLLDGYKEYQKQLN